MHNSLITLAALSLSATLFGCGASATIPSPPSGPATGPPPGTSPEMAKIKKDGAGGVGAAKPSNQL